MKTIELGVRVKDFLEIKTVQILMKHLHIKEWLKGRQGPCVMLIT